MLFTEYQKKKTNQYVFIDFIKKNYKNRNKINAFQQLIRNFIEKKDEYVKTYNEDDMPSNLIIRRYSEQFLIFRSVEDTNI